MLCNSTEIESSDEYLTDIMKLFYNLTRDSMHPFVFLIQWNDHWSHNDKKMLYLYQDCTMDTTNLTRLGIKCL